MRFDSIKRSTALTVVLGFALALFAAMPMSAFGEAAQTAPAGAAPTTQAAPADATPRPGRSCQDAAPRRGAPAAPAPDKAAPPASNQRCRSPIMRRRRRAFRAMRAPRRLMCRSGRSPFSPATPNGPMDSRPSPRRSQRCRTRSRPPGSSRRGRLSRLFLSTDDTSFHYQAMIPLTEKPEGKTELSEDVKLGESPSGKAIKFLHRGAYDDIDSTYDLITAYLDEKGLEAKNLFIEEYLSDTKESDDATSASGYLCVFEVDGGPPGLFRGLSAKRRQGRLLNDLNAQWSVVTPLAGVAKCRRLRSCIAPAPARYRKSSLSPGTEASVPICSLSSGCRWPWTR